MVGSGGGADESVAFHGDCGEGRKGEVGFIELEVENRWTGVKSGVKESLYACTTS